MRKSSPDEIGKKFLALFDRIYIINLAFRQDRLIEISKQLAHIGLMIGAEDIRRFNAVRPEEAGPWPSVGARGCFLSHLTVLQEATADRLQSVAILEDDLDWSNAFLETSPEDIAMIGQGAWQYLHGGVTNAPGPISLRHLAPNEKLLQTHFIAFRGDAISRAAMYLEAMAARSPGSSDGGPMHVDGAYNWFRSDNPDIPAALCEPAIGHQRSSVTDISKRAWFDSTPVVRNLARIYRKIKRLM